jgi:hypothetical protein
VGTSLLSVAFSPDGSLLAGADPTANQIDVLSGAADGALTPITGSPFSAGPAGDGPGSVVCSVASGR